MTRRGQSRRKSLAVAFCGMAAGLSVALMLTGGVIPVATYAAPLLAAVLLIPVRIEFSGRAALGTWLVTAALALILGLDKEAAFFYLFVCWWPAAKWTVDLHIRRGSLRLAVKTAVFSLTVCAMYAFLAFLLKLDTVVAEFGEMGAWLTACFLVLTVLCLLLYDRLLIPVSILYVRRIQPRLHFLRRRA